MSTPLREVLASFDISVKINKLDEARRRIQAFEAQLKHVDDQVRAAAHSKLADMTAQYAGQAYGVAKTRLLQYAATMAAAVYVGRRMFLSSVEQADALRNQADELGVSTQEIQRFTYAAELMGISTRDASQTLRLLDRSAGTAALGVKGSQKAFAELGISATDAKGKVRPLWDILGDLADYAQKNPDKALAATNLLARSIGGTSARLVPLLKSGRAGIKAMMGGIDQIGGPFGKDYFENMLRARVALATLKASFRNMVGLLSAEFSPAIEWVARKIGEFSRTVTWVNKHTYALRTALMALGAGAVIVGLQRLVSLAQAFGVASEVSFGMAALEVAGLVVGIAFLYAAFDDFYTWLQGGGSVIGDALGGDNQKVLADTKQLLSDMSAAAEDVAAGLTSAFIGAIPGAIEIMLGLMRALGVTVAVVAAGLDVIVQTFSAVGGFLAKAGTVIGNIASQADFGTNAAGQSNAPGLMDGVDKVGNTDAFGDKFRKRISSYNGLLDASIGDHPAVQAAQAPANQGTYTLKPISVAGPMSAQQASDAADRHLGLPPPPPPKLDLTINNNFHGPADAGAVGQATRDAGRQAGRELTTNFALEFGAVSR